METNWKTPLPDTRQFRAWLAIGPPGSSLVYYVGNLGFDREVNPEPKGWMKETLAVAAAAWRAYENGEVELKQMRCGTGRWAYIAQKQQKHVRTRL